MKKIYPQIFQGTSVSIFSQIQPFLGSLGCPVSFEKTPPDIHPRNKFTKYQPNLTIFGLCRLPEGFGLIWA